MEYQFDAYDLAARPELNTVVHVTTPTGEKITMVYAQLLDADGKLPSNVTPHPEWPGCYIMTQ